MTEWEVMEKELEVMDKFQKFQKCLKMFSGFSGVRQRENDEEDDCVIEEDLEYKELCRRVINYIVDEYAECKWGEWEWYRIYDYEEFKEGLKKEIKLNSFQLNAYEQGIK